MHTALEVNATGKARHLLLLIKLDNTVVIRLRCLHRQGSFLAMRSDGRSVSRAPEKKEVWRSKQKEDVELLLRDLPHTLMRTQSDITGRSKQGSQIIPLRSRQSERSLRTSMDVATDDNRYKWCMRLMAKSNTSALRKEFVRHKTYKPPEYTYEFCKKNEAKNRYDDVICIDSTRVILKERPPDDDYIHANWMVMPDGQKYICTQGPIQETITDFWHMIYTEKSTVIVMLCAFKEGKNEKCALYHPKTKSECGKYGQYRVFLKENKANPYKAVKHTVLSVRRDRKYAIEVNHLSCSEWPDHTAPLDPGPIVGMMKLARLLCRGNPITVHCSAGIGRSATFVGIDCAMQRIKEDQNTSMVDILKELRNQRFQSVQGIIQYIFLHICVLEGFADEGIIDRKGKFAQYMADYTRMLTIFNRRVAAKMKSAEK